MTLYLETPQGFTRWAGEAIDGTRYPLSITTMWSTSELAAIGLYEPAEAAAIPDGKISAGVSVTRVSGVVRHVHDLINKPVPTLAVRRADALATLADKRWAVETGGVEVMGINVRTDEIGQSKLTGAMVAMDNDPTLTDIDWEAAPGIWVSLDGPTISGLSYVVARHVQACFSRARVISEVIQSAGTHAAMDAAIELIETGWPGQE